MFCGKCGSQVPEGSAFCSSCGAPVGKNKPIQAQNQARQMQQNIQQNYQQQVRQTQARQAAYGSDGFAAPKPVNNKKKFIILGAIAAAVVVVILLIVFLGGSGSTATPEGTIKKLEKGLNDMNTATIMECFDAESQSYFSGSDYDLKGLTDAFGVKYSFTLNPVSVTPSYYEDGKEYCDVTVNITISGSAFGQTYNDSSTEQLTLVHENGQWKIPSRYYSEIMGSMSMF